MATPKVKTKQVNFRMPLDLLKRLDQHAKRMQKQLPGLRIDRTGALKFLLEKALAAEEAESITTSSGERGRQTSPKNR